MCYTVPAKNGGVVNGDNQGLVPWQASSIPVTSTTWYQEKGPRYEGFSLGWLENISSQLNH